MATVSHSARKRRPAHEIIPEGTRFGRLVIISGPFARFPRDFTSRFYFRCKCDCGKACDVQVNNLRSGNTGSCGCGKRESQLIHGESRSRVYRLRTEIIQRCYNPKRAKYARYGGRGIYVCQEWLESYEAFRDWSLANGYEDGLEIERKNNDGPYSPDNCRWATRKEQCHNTSRNRNHTAFGETKCLSAWAGDDRCQVSLTGLQWRLSKGWDFADALVTPPDPRKQRVQRKPSSANR